MRPDTRTALQGVALFRDLPETELEELGRRVVRKRYGRGELIFSQGDHGDGLYLIVDGHVNITRQSPDGGELVLAMIGPGDHFGELALFDAGTRSASAAALDMCHVLFLAGDAFRSFMATHPATVMACLEAVVRQLRRLTDVADEMALLDVRSRLARRLVALADQGLVDVSDGQARTTGRRARITQQHLANMLGATRESVNKHLRAFEDDGLIMLVHGNVRVLDRAGLIACGDGLA